MDTITKLGTVFASFVICQLVFHFLSSWFSARVFPQFSSLTSEWKIEWNLRVVYTCRASVVGVFSLCIFLFYEAATADPHWDVPRLANVNVAIATGYIISDALLFLFYWRTIGRIDALIQRFTGLYVFFLMLKEEELAYIASFRLLLQVSNLFFNQRWFVKTLRYSESSEAYIISGIFRTEMFVILWTAVIPTFYYCIYSVYGTDAYLRLGLLTRYSWIGSFIVLDVINIIQVIRNIME